MNLLTGTDRVLKTVYGDSRKKLHLTPIARVMKELERRGVDLGSLHVLEMFAGTGDMHTAEYVPYVASLEGWEIEPAFEAALRKNLPNATIRIVDSYEQLRITKSKFDLIVADTWTEMFGGHCEHFELFPEVFRALNRSAILILNIMLDLNEKFFPAEHLKHRQNFYQVDDPKQVPLQRMIKVYSTLSRQNGYEIKWWFTKDRYSMYPLRKRFKKKRLCYLVLGLERMSRDDAGPNMPAENGKAAIGGYH